MEMCHVHRDNRRGLFSFARSCILQHTIAASFSIIVLYAVIRKWKFKSLEDPLVFLLSAINSTTV